MRLALVRVLFALVLGSGVDCVASAHLRGGVRDELAAATPVSVLDDVAVTRRPTPAPFGGSESATLKELDQVGATNREFHLEARNPTQRPNNVILTVGGVNGNIIRNNGNTGILSRTGSNGVAFVRRSCLNSRWGCCSNGVTICINQVCNNCPKGKPKPK